ncbi:MAG TPA: hypothetical protein VG035_04780 [Actinomycetota bacterium]|nr:hypothetical protein [Actinomycetota bacterium]
MGLDVYVGSLTRSYLEGSADVVDRIARRQGLPVDDGQDAEEVIRTAVVRWRDRLSSWLGDRLAAPLDWDESGPAPCFTDKPGWDGYGGALLLAAHDEHPELPAPARVSADWPDDPAYLAASAPGAGSRYHQLLTPELWLPCRFDFTVRTQDLTGEEVELGSSEALLGQLELLSARYRLDSQPPELAADGRSLSAAAGNGLAVLRRLAERSVINRVPMILDF